MKKKIMILMLAAVMGVAVIACGSKEETDSVKEETKDTKTIYIYQNKVEIDESLKVVADKYKETHPNIDFIIESTSDNYSTGLKTKFTGGEAPDIFSIAGYSDAKTWETHLLDLSEEAWSSDMLEASRENISIDSKVYAFPLAVEGAGYVYNKDLFQKAGITKLPTTPEELTESVEMLNVTGVVPLTQTYMDWYQPGNFFTNYGFAAQDDPRAFIDGLNEGTESFVGNEAFTEVANFLLKEYALSANPSTTDFNTQTSMISSQELAMTFGGNWSQSAFDEVDPDLPVGLMAVPVFEDSSKNQNLYVLTTYWGINKNSEAAEEAREFVEWLATTEEGQLCMTEDLKLIPPYKSFSADPDSVGSLGEDVINHIEDGTVSGIYNAFYPDGGAQAFGEEIQKLVAGKYTVEEFLQGLQDSWDSLN